MFYIVIREEKPNDFPAISEVVRNAYLSNVKSSWLNALLSETTFQFTVLLTALLFIVFHVPLLFCLISVPCVLMTIYVIIYGAFTMKAAQITYEKKPLKCWVAEAYEPLFYSKSPKDCWYKMIREEDMEKEGIKPDGRRRIIGTTAVMKHFQQDDGAWLFRLAVDQQYRRKGVGLKLIEEVKNWCRENKYNNIEVAMSECQEGARELFNEAGFEIKQLYHKKLLSSAYTLQMFHLRCTVRPTFS